MNKGHPNVTQENKVDTKYESDEQMAHNESQKMIVKITSGTNTKPTESSATDTHAESPTNIENGIDDTKPSGDTDISDHIRQDKYRAAKITHAEEYRTRGNNCQAHIAYCINYEEVEEARKKIVSLTKNATHNVYAFITHKDAHGMKHDGERGADDKLMNLI